MLGIVPVKAARNNASQEDLGRYHISQPLPEMLGLEMRITEGYNLNSSEKSTSGVQKRTVQYDIV